MVEQERPDGREAPQIVFVGRVIAVPGDDVERGMIEFRRPERTAPFHMQQGLGVALLVMGDRREEVARIGEAVRADRSALGQRQRATVVFAQITCAKPSISSTRNFTPRGTMAISPGAASMIPNSVASLIAPSCGTNSNSPSAL